MTSKSTPPPTEKSTRLVFTPNRAILIMTLLLVPVLIALGFWQISRAAQKRSMERAYAAQQARPPQALNKKSLATLAVYTRVIARGHFDNRHIWLVDNSQRNGLPGYEVVQPLVLQSGVRVLVNRGWLQAPPQRDKLPSIPLPTGQVTVFAQLAAAQTHPLLSARSPNKHWPKIITMVVPSVMARALGQPLAANYLKIDDASTGALVADWQPVNMTPERHMGYAVQWFAMALALVIWSLFANTNLAAYWRQRKPTSPQHKDAE